MIILNLSAPDFLVQFTTGIVCSCFDLKKGYALALSTNGEVIDVSPNKKYGLFFLKHKKRDFDFEKQMRAKFDLTGVLEVVTFRKATFLNVSGSDIQAVYNAALELC